MLVINEKAIECIVIEHKSEVISRIRRRQQLLVVTNGLFLNVANV